MYQFFDYERSVRESFDDCPLGILYALLFCFDSLLGPETLFRAPYFIAIALERILI